MSGARAHEEAVGAQVGGRSRSKRAGYGAFSLGATQIPAVRAHIGRQAEHHRRVSSYDEVRALLVEHGIEFDERNFE